jgi:hypothetical protein
LWKKNHHVFSSERDSREHHLLKVPHHGSLKDQVDAFLERRADGDSRTWSVTPYNTSDLPKLEAGQGVEILLKAEDSLHLTGLPLSKANQLSFPPPGRISTAQLGKAIEGELDPFLVDATEVRNLNPLEALDAVWCFQINNKGEIKGK